MRHDGGRGAGTGPRAVRVADGRGGRYEVRQHGSPAGPLPMFDMWFTRDADGLLIFLGTAAPDRPPRPRATTPDAVSRHVGAWCRAVIARDLAEVARIEDLMRRESE